MTTRARAIHDAASLSGLIRGQRNEQRAGEMGRYFKTGPGEYGEGDRFLGLRAAQIRQVAKQGRGLGPAGVRRLLRSPWHEERSVALRIWIHQFERGDATIRERIYRSYLRHTRRINNWDLVDVSAHRIVGAWLEDKDRSILRQLAASSSLWERRIAIIATFWFIRRDDFDDALALARQLLGDPEDLIHKAVGWMLREVGNRDRPAEETFLRAHYHRMPRTMLRYAIEKFPEPLRRRYLKGRI